MLYPQSNEFRSQLRCSDLWNFRVDPQKIGEREGWNSGFESDLEIAVPGSWNEQFEESGLTNYVGFAWYSTTVFIPREWSQGRSWIRVGSADFEATVWVNGIRAGGHKGGFLPFELEVTGLVRFGQTNTLTIRVSNQLSAGSIPQGITTRDYEREGRLREETYPPARFDFFPYGGIHRPVIFCLTPRRCLTKILIDTTTGPRKTGNVRVRIAADSDKDLMIRCSLPGVRLIGEQSAVLKRGSAVVSFKIPSCLLWSPQHPHLYTLQVELIDEDVVVDKYEMEFGVREVIIRGGKLLLNGRPLYLQGFGRHEDFPVLGRASSPALLVKDFGLMKWVNANSFRTSHYPYSEEMMAMADRNGFLVIDEIPAVSLDLRKATRSTLRAHKQAIESLIDRDYNHPCVIAWALGNEPNLVGEDNYQRGAGTKYWHEVFSFARSLDKTRHFTVPNCSRVGVDDPVFKFSDIISINRYYGWYEFPGRVDHAVSVLERELDVLHRKYGKPVFVTEFGADTIPGMHSVASQMFTEEYQVELLEKYIKLLRSKPYVIGEHVWNFADFRTPQHFRRVVLNMKGVFTRTRQPKAAAFTLKKLWQASRYAE